MVFGGHIVKETKIVGIDVEEKGERKDQRGMLGR
jgi:hypothetical protein